MIDGLQDITIYELISTTILKPTDWHGAFAKGEPMATETTGTATMTVDELLGKLETARLTRNHYKLITTAMLGDMLEFFDYWIIGFVLAFIVIPWKLSFAATAIVLLSAGAGSLKGALGAPGWNPDLMSISTAMMVPSRAM